MGAMFGVVEEPATPAREGVTDIAIVVGTVVAERERGGDLERQLPIDTRERVG